MPAMHIHLQLQDCQTRQAASGYQQQEHRKSRESKVMQQRSLDMPMHLHDDFEDVVRYQWCLLTILGIDVIVHDFDPADHPDFVVTR